MKRIGIVGGMGPLASIFYAQQLILQHPVSCDQDQFHIVLDSNSSIPDRTQALLNNTQSPVNAIRNSLTLLSYAQVDVGFITCFTSHAFFDEFKSAANFTLLNVFDVLTSSHILNGHKVGLLATSGTLRTQLFQNALPHVDFLLPTPSIQESCVMKGIYDPLEGIKSNHLNLGRQHLEKAIQHLIEHGATCILAGCTEVGLALHAQHYQVPIVDPMMNMVETIIAIAQ